MATGEFDIIEQFFTHPVKGPWQSQGVGDDCALITLGQQRIAVTTDMMAMTTHFLADANPEDVGYKALAVNLSDLAAAGAIPRAFFLGLGLAQRDDAWLSGFSRGMMALAQSAGCFLLGGDTTRTPVVQGQHAPNSICITAIGELPPDAGLTRAGACIGDDIWVSGFLGAPYAALMHHWGKWQMSSENFALADVRLHRPEPRNQLGQALLKIATACADISDGLVADVGHIAERSKCQVLLSWDALPVHPSLKELDDEQLREALLFGGDEYELVFSAPVTARTELQALSKYGTVSLHRIGTIRSGNGVWLETKDGEQVSVTGGFNHFSEN